ncbi:MAG: sigma-54-dependent Fis family transcriptional regulator [Candidatus Marinimicrobia bacterium]|nr:sigma-54-dependent Fis family transcriptional regulator [Candidatus Neomarinimicrobiota bacterium]
MSIEPKRIQKKLGIIGNSEKIQSVLEMVAQVSPVDISVMISGNSGVGKELIAKAVHFASKRNNNPLIIVNCGAIPEGIIESELFGHIKGSFTGAGENRKGYFEEANKGTIFLDEIGEMPLETQVKLLRVLESGEFMRVGEAKTRYTDVRIIAATNKNLEDLVRRGQFRNDLYYRLKTVFIEIPTLKQRIEDIALLVERFSLEFTRSNDLLYRGFMPDAIRIMKKYEWPGNIRELKNFVEKILVIEKGERITKEMVERELINFSPNLEINPALPMVVNKSTDKAEIDLILRQLFLLKQDTELIQKLFVSNSISHVDNANLNVLDNYNSKELHMEKKSMEITQDGHYLIRDDAIGDFTLPALEEEAIRRSLRFFNDNRRKTAKKLGMSERTLYRKIEEYNIDPKFKKPN